MPYSCPSCAEEGYIFHVMLCASMKTGAKSAWTTLWRATGWLEYKKIPLFYTFFYNKVPIYKIFLYFCNKYRLIVVNDAG